MSECIYEALYAFLQKSHTAALATVIKTKGSTPREVGARMLVGPQGLVTGTVGGGGGEGKVIRAAERVLKTGRPEVVRVNLTAPIRMEAQGLCGGVYWVLVERWTADSGTLEILRRLVEAVQRRKRVARVVLVPESEETPATVGAVYVPSEGITDVSGFLESRPHLRNRVVQLVETGGLSTTLPVEDVEGASEVFVDVVLPPPRLVILGAGHIAVPLAQMASLHDYHVVVVDDRPGFAVPERFPTADELVTMPLVEALEGLEADHNTYLIFVTRSHALDVEGLATVWGRGYPYIGLIGSRRRIRAVRELLQKRHGIDLENWPEVYAPVGLNIGAETPAEIATSILAELTLVRRGGTGQSLSREVLRPTTQAVPEVTS